MARAKDYYSVLGLKRNATAEEIRDAYFKAARRLHPDRNTAPGETELFLESQEAYEILSNPDRRLKYDLLLPPEETESFILDQRISISRQSLIRIPEPQLIYSLLEFTCPVNRSSPPAPTLNLCMVLDRSTSMQGIKMDVVKATTIQIMRKLKPKDIFSVVTFSDRAEQVIPSGNMMDLGKMEARIQMLQPSGGTEIFSGLSMGYHEIMLNVQKAQVNHIILLTDGHTYGDEEKCLDLARQASEKKVGISGLGIGSDWNDTFLDALASGTGGSSMYVSRPKDIQNILLNKFNRLEKAYTIETYLDYKIPEGVDLRFAFRLQPEPGVLSLENPMILGPVERKTSMKVLLEFVIQPQANKQDVITFFSGILSVTLAEERSATEPIPISLNCPIKDEAGPDIPSPEIMEALSQLRLYRLQEQALLEVAAGDFDQASEHLNRLATHLLSQGERSLARTVLLEAENIQQEKSFSQQGRKEIKYGTRALLTAARRSEES
jgi:Ca-activated chloride channel family protein